MTDFKIDKGQIYRRYDGAMVRVFKREQQAGTGHMMIHYTVISRRLDERCLEAMWWDTMPNGKQRFELVGADDGK